MGRVLYSPGDKVVIHDNSGAAKSHVSIGDVLTVKKKMNTMGSIYYFKEIRCCLSAKRFKMHEEASVPIEYRKGDKVIVTRDFGKAKLGDILTINQKRNDDMYSFKSINYCLREQSFKPYHPNSDEYLDKYDGWVNAATAEAAMVFFNDSSMIKRINAELIGRVYANVKNASGIIRSADINSCHNRQEICTRAILEKWITEEQVNHDVTDSRFKAVMDDLGSHFDFIDPSLEDQAQNIAAERFPEHRKFVASLLLKPEMENQNIMSESQVISRVSTKNYINGADVANLDTNTKVGFIKATEDQIADLEKVKTPSKMVAKEIASLKENLKKAVELFDAE